MLFVQSSEGALLTDSSLTLFRVNDQTGWFIDRPYRQAGQISTEGFTSFWKDLTSARRAGPFAYDPPNADFTCTVNGQVINYVLELDDPIYAGSIPDVFCESCPSLTYRIRVIGEDLPFESASCDGAAHVFIADCLDCAKLFIFDGR